MLHSEASALKDPKYSYTVTSRGTSCWAHTSCRQLYGRKLPCTIDRISLAELIIWFCNDTYEKEYILGYISLFRVQPTFGTNMAPPCAVSHREQGEKLHEDLSEKRAIGTFLLSIG
jgi:hypothetical protein